MPSSPLPPPPLPSSPEQLGDAVKPTRGSRVQKPRRSTTQGNPREESSGCTKTNTQAFTRAIFPAAVGGNQGKVSLREET
ncbi:hypothetical protein VTH82DRAFT_1756 [Thermothelomyces myriococcoides]